MSKHKMNFETKTLTISREFEKIAISKPNSNESRIMKQCRALCPDLKIAYYTRKSSSSKPYGGLTYKKMEDYIRLYENANELLKMFCLIKAISQIQKNKFKYVYNWFIRQFPDYDKMPEIINGKLYTPLIDVPEVNKVMLEAVA